MRTHTPLTTLLITTAATAAAITGCSSEGPAPSVATSGAPTRPAAAVSQSPTTAAQEALAAYAAMWADVQAVGMTSNYQDPRLADHMQGQPMVTFRENISVDQAHGVVGRGAPVLHPSVIATTVTTVTLRDCLDDSNWIKVYSATGKPVNDVPGGHRYVAAIVTNENGAWMVTSLDVRAEGTCT